MPGEDRFELEKELRIRKSGIRQVFTPSRPVVDIELLFEREAEVARLVAIPGTPGRHAIIFGHRGVGKSSLARASGVLLGPLFPGKVISVQCDAATTFSQLIAGPLRRNGLNPDVVATEVTETTAVEGRAGVSSTGVAGSHQTTRSHSTAHSSVITPAQAVAHLKDFPQLLVIDEADAITLPGVHGDIAEFIKLLSDEDSAFRVLVVGIAGTASSLTGNHPSVQRCLEQIHLSKLSAAGVRKLVNEGFKKISMTVDPAVVREIVYFSDGIPHFAHQLALKSGENAIGENRSHVEMIDLENAITMAALASEADLQSDYDAATVSAGTTAYTDLVAAAASIDGRNIPSESLRAAYRMRTGIVLTQNGLNNYLGRLLSDDSSRILTRVARGIYCFTDPRMPAFVRILNGRRS